MAEMDRFERRFERALGRLADEVPTAVDAAETARAVVAAGGRRGRWSVPFVGSLPRAAGLAPVLRFALLPAAVLLLTFGIFGIAQRIALPPYAGMAVGTMTCPGEPWTLSASAAIVLDCTAELDDPRLSGTVHLEMGAPRVANGLAARTGTMVLRTSAGPWAGNASLVTGPNGLTVADAALVGDGDAAGSRMRLHLISPDGLRWGFQAWVEATP